MTFAFSEGVRSILLACVLLIATPLVSAAQDFAPVLVGGHSEYVVKNGDTITAIAGRFGVSTAAVIELNGLKKPGVIVPGQTLSIDHWHLAIAQRDVAITINVAQRLLVFASSDRVEAYPITVGRSSWPTPLGRFTIATKERDPVWDVPLSIQNEMLREGKPVITRMPPSPDNPLGTRWLGLSLPGIGIHGTNAPASIYQFASHGCIRMHPEDVERLFDEVEVGDTGVIIYQPVIMALIDGRVFIEVNPDPYRRATQPLRDAREQADRGGFTDRVDWQQVEAAVRARAARPIDVTRATTW